MRWFAAVSLLVACGAKPPQGSWVERDDSSIGLSRVEPKPNDGPAQPAATDLSRLTGGALMTAIDALAEDQLRATLQAVGDNPPAGRLALRAARLAWHYGDDDAARAWLARVASAADRAEVAADASALAARLTTSRVDPAVVAVLLPLTGRYAAIGNELKLAVQLAPALGTTWLFLDTAGEPDKAVAQVHEASARGAVAILGPVGDREAIAAARAAALHRIAIALLAPADGADVGTGVFRVIDSPADEGRAVAQVAHADGFPTAGVFAPRDDVGQQAADAFVAEATKRGITVTARGVYDPTGGNLEPEIKEFLNLIPARNPRLADHLARRGKDGWKSFTPDMPYALLFIPDRHDRAALVAAFLPYFGVELRTGEATDPETLRRKHGGVLPHVVQLIGGAGWHNASLPIRGGAAVQGAMFVDSCPGELGSDAGAQFAAEFTRHTQRAPSTAAAQTFDAATMIAQVRRGLGSRAAGDHREAFRTGFARAALTDGACGPASIGGDGELVREMALFEVAGNDLQLVP